MRIITIKSCLSALLIGGLTACESATLIDLNKDFVTLMQQTEEAKQLHRSRVLDTTNFDSAIEGFRVAFAETGKKAVESANKAETPQNKASFLNVAVRNYLKSRPVGDTKVPDLAKQGIAACTSKDIRGLKALPVTCGYFYIVVPQAISNEWQRKVTVLQRQAEELRKPPRKFLTSAQGKQLQEAFGRFIGQLDALETTAQKIDWTNADKKLREGFNRQQDIFLCNARGAHLLLTHARKTDGTWDRDAVKTQLKTKEDEWVNELKEREVKFPKDTCLKLRNPGT